MEEKVITGNVFDKYNVKNPIYKKMMHGFFSNFMAYIESVKGNEAFNILEIGCGEGLLAYKIIEKFENTKITGLDLDDEIIAEAKQNCPGAHFEVGSVYDLSKYYNEKYDVVIASEVLEHIDQPEAALNEIKKLNSEYFLFSVPHEPIWRVLNMARFKYLNKLGNTPGHIQHFSKSSFQRLLGQHFEIIESKKVFPWLMALCKKK